MSKKKMSSFVLVLSLFAFPALAQEMSTQPEVKPSPVIDVSTLPSEVLTTIAEIRVSQDGKSATVYADNDVRLFKVNEGLMLRVAELIEAEKNTLQVLLTVQPIEGASTYEIVAFKLMTFNTPLTTGYNKPDRQFSPIVAESVDEIHSLFRSVYPYKDTYYDVNDNCFNRALYWSRSIQVKQEKEGSHKGTDKIFIFFTETYMSKFKHKWWYHVAPVVYLDTKTKPYVLDPTFMNEEATLKEWLSAFDAHTDGNCKRIKTVDEYYENADKAICLYTLVSMFHYNPSDLQTRKMSNWRCEDFDSMKAAIPAPGTKSGRFPNAKWTDAKNKVLIPEMCKAD